MPRPYSEDLRLRVAQAVEHGKTTREVGALFHVSPSFVSRIHQLWRKSGRVPSKPIGGYRRAILEPYADALAKQLSQPVADLEGTAELAGNRTRADE